MAKLSKQNRFNFVGTLKFGKDITATRQLGQSAWSSTRANVGIKDNENMQFLNIDYMHSNGVTTAKLLGKDSQMIEVPLSKTADKDVLSQCADFVKTTIDIETDFEKKKEYLKLVFKKRNHEMKKEEEKTQEDFDKITEYTKQIEEQALNRHEFAHMKDVIAFLEANKEALDGKRVRVMGSVKTNYYNGKTSLQYVPSMIELVEDDIANGLRATTDFMFEKSGIEDLKKEKKILIHGYIMDRVKKKDVLVPLTTSIDYNKIDLENAEHVMLLDYMKGIFEIKDKKQIHKMGIELNVVNGREVAEFDESMLTPQQQMAIKLGMNKVDDFKPRGNVYGEKISDLKVINGDFKSYPQGSVELFPISELDDYLITSTAEIKEQKDEENKTESTDSSEKIANLFG